VKTADIVRAMSDHQLVGLVEVMLEDDHCADDKTELYVAAYAEAERRNLLEED
jgi:hypothetical protein